jgi:hypothetical protein
VLFEAELLEAELLLGRRFIRVPNAAAPAKSTGDLHVLVDGVWTKLPARWGFRDRRYASHVGRAGAVAENSCTTGLHSRRVWAGVNTQRARSVMRPAVVLFVLLAITMGLLIVFWYRGNEF